MASLFWLIPISIGFVVGACVLFGWAVDHDQFDDLDRESQRILLDDELTEAKGNSQ